MHNSVHNAGLWRPERSNILRLSGMPYEATRQTILQFFQGYRVPKGVEGVHMVIGPFRKFNGEAYVEFVSEAVANDALAKDRAIMGNQGRYVEVGCRRATPLLATLPPDCQQVAALIACASARDAPTYSIACC